MSVPVVTNPLVAIREGGRRRPLFCVHPVGGHIGDYVELAARLSPEQPVWGLRSRGLVDARAEHRTVTALAAEYADLIGPVSDEPLRLFGWSFGGIIAHAMACELERRGREVELVGMIDPPNRLEHDEEPLRVAAWMAVMIFHPSPPPRSVIRGTLKALDSVPAHEVAAWCIEHGLLPAHGIPLDEFTAAIGLLPIHRAMLIAHQPAVARAPLVVWRPRLFDAETARDWAPHTSSQCTTTYVGGDHFTIIRPPHVDPILAALDALG